MYIITSYFTCYSFVFVLLLVSLPPPLTSVNVGYRTDYFNIVNIVVLTTLII